MAAGGKEKVIRQHMPINRKSSVKIIAGCSLLAGLSLVAPAMDTALLRAIGGVVDVTAEPYFADNTGGRDATAELRRAMHDAARRTPGIFTAGDRAVQILFLPNGIYRVSEPLVFDTPEILAARPKSQSIFEHKYVSGHMMLMGESRGGTIIRLADRSPVFQAAGASVVRMTSAAATNQGYFNSVVDLTIDTGFGNPGATALWFVSNNLGTVRGVRLVSPDRESPAGVGLELTAGTGGLGYLRDIEIEGFRTGILSRESHVGYTLEEVRLRGQTQVGIDNADKNLFIRRLVSDNLVPALHNRTAQGLVVLLDSELRGGDPAAAAIVADGPLLARAVASSGYRSALAGREGAVIDEAVVGGVFTLWSDAPLRTMGLEVRDPPAGGWDTPASWHVFDPARQGDDTVALQAAIDSGAETVVIKSDLGRVELSDTVHLRGNLRRLHGGWGNLDVRHTGPVRPLFHIEPGARDGLVLEALSYGQRVHGFIDVVNDSANAVILRDLFLGYGASTYRNGGSGDLFLESVVSGGGDYDYEGMRPVAGWLLRGQRTWARNFNPEAYAPGLQVEGGSFWCLGAKLGEIYGPYLEAHDGARVEMLGAVLNTTPEKHWRPERLGYALRAVDSEVAFCGVDRIRAGAGEGPNPVQIVEERGAVRRQILHQDLPRRLPNRKPTDPSSVVVPLFRSAGSRTEPR
jgi:hypothetical protein